MGSSKDGLIGRLVGGSGKYSNKQIAETLDLLVATGVERGATDIHIEPRDQYIIVRYRVDGNLRAIHRLPHNALSRVMARLKDLAGLRVDEIRAPQEGSYIQNIGDKKIEVELSTMPVFGGEKAVLHLSRERGKPADLEQLGFWGDGLNAIEDVLARPYGLVAVVGPKHSGKITTMFAMLHSLNNPLINIASVETKAKYRLHGVNQTFVNGSMTIAQGLQAAMKQDANVVMLSDLPDKHTTELAIHAATTGHLIVSGMHASDSIQAVLRLRAAGVEPFLLATALRVVVSQRLVRIACPKCRVRHSPTPAEQKELLASLGLSGSGILKTLHQLESKATPAIFGDVKQLSSSEKGIINLWEAHPSGCDNCDYSGYTGQTAITEVLTAGDTLQKALMSKDPVSATTLRDNLIKNGFVPMALDGLVKALRGQTTISEILRAVQMP